ncbi:hypothetical protein Ppb6_01989 [Photorhabdus australis subsp. thailandensis]|uniref:Uncharacterized protein n=1 Tax=Photorhabdus australis subsp. thailandensis TaxID=2805096 RepID=A0A1C0U431_9GAMM|nr:hypothetical protein [Photorhabdus australis]OCQ52646.1 hypothetical protein Ppb6_01989 [Photorhabdus australis subsp. thailandensis]
MSSKKVKSIGPLKAIEIYSVSNVLVPTNVPAVIIKNNSGASAVRIISYWARLVGEYHQYNSVDIDAGELKIFSAPMDLIYRYKIVVTNLSDSEVADIEFVMEGLWRETGIPSRLIRVTSHVGEEIYNSGNAVLPIEFNDAVIKNNSQANIRVESFWAGPFKHYNSYGYVNIHPGKAEILAAPPNVINYYKIVIANLSPDVPDPEVEVISHLWDGHK